MLAAVWRGRIATWICATGGVGVAQLRPSENYSGAAAAWLGGESQAGLPVDAGRQPAMCAEAEVRGDHGLESRPSGVSELGGGDGADWHRPVVGSRYHLHSAGESVRLPGGGDRCFFAPCDWLGAGRHGGRRPPSGSPADGAEIAAAGAWAGASFGSRQPVRLRRLYRPAEGPRLPNQYEPQGEPLGKCRM